MLCIDHNYLVTVDGAPFAIDASTAPACRQLIKDYAGEKAATAFDDLIAKAGTSDAFFGTSVFAELDHDVRQAAFMLNKMLLAESLVKYIAGFAEAKYAGDGDGDGGIESVTCSNLELLKLDAAKFELVVQRDAQAPRKEGEREPEPERSFRGHVMVTNVEFADALADLAGEAITLTDHDGYGFNGRACGTFTLLADGTATLRHVDYKMVEDVSEHAL